MPQASILQTFDQEDLTVDATVGGVRLTLSYILTTPPAKAATLTVETAQIRWTCDGTTPTTTVGNPMDAGDSIVISGAQNIKQFRAIRTGGTSGSLNVTFLKQ